MSYNPTTVYIDLEALHHNLNKIKSIAPNSNVLAVIKRDAYHHGAFEVAKSIEHDVGAFGVIFLKEAVQLRQAGIKKPIVILTGFLDQDELNVASKLDLECVIHSGWQMEVLEQTKLPRPLHVWLKIDTGMHRLGFQPQQVQENYQKLMANKMVQKPLRLMTHFSDADNITQDKTAVQIELFEKIVTNLEGELCMANSSAVLNWPKARVCWIRPGVTLHGVSPVAGKTGADFGLKPVMTLASRIIAIHDLEMGATVGYGSTFVCPEKMRIGTVAIGYGDGYPRSLKTGTPILINGVRTQLIGRVAMDMIGVDLRGIPDAKIGTQAILWGKDLAVEEIAASINTIPYELFCHLPESLHYQFCKKSSDVFLASKT